MDFSPELNVAVETILRTNATVLITGHPGAGKTAVALELARRLTDQSVLLYFRKGVGELTGAGELPWDSFFEVFQERPQQLAANVVIVDGVELASPRQQQEILSFLTDKGAGIRVIATARELKGLVAAGRFDEGLYYRLNVIPIELGEKPLPGAVLHGQFPQYSLLATSFSGLGKSGTAALSARDSFDVRFDARCTPDDVRSTLEALADYFRACGGVGLSVNLELEHLELEELAGAPR